MELRECEGAIRECGEIAMEWVEQLREVLGVEGHCESEFLRVFAVKLGEVAAVNFVCFAIL